jgi:hypothetical protein
VESLSLSKYRLGIAMLAAPDADREYVEERAGLFRLESAANAD